eukprot:gene18744-19733_t
MALLEKDAKELTDTVETTTLAPAEKSLLSERARPVRSTPHAAVAT